MDEFVALMKSGRATRSRHSGHERRAHAACRQARWRICKAADVAASDGFARAGAAKGGHGFAKWGGGNVRGIKGLEEWVWKLDRFHDNTYRRVEFDTV
jgi:hypothetical protein